MINGHGAQPVPPILSGVFNRKTKKNTKKIIVESLILIKNVSAMCVSDKLREKLKDKN